MNPKTLCLLIAIAFAQPARADELSGFVPLEHASVPLEVRAAADSVFHVALLPDVRVAFATIQALFDSFTLFNREIYRRETRACRVDTACVVRGRLYVGSAYLTEPDVLSTAYHVLPPSQDHAFIYVFDRRGLPVFEGEVTLEVPVQSWEMFSERPYFPAADQARIRLPRALGRPLTEADVEPGAPTFGLGFPEPTRDRVHDSDGEILTVTLGRALTFEDAMERIGGVPSGFEGPFVELQKKTALFSTNDTNRGSSGGPLVDARGRVLGTIGAASPGYAAGPRHTTIAAKINP